MRRGDLDTILVIVLVAIASVGFRSVFSSWDFLPETIFGASVAGLLVLICRGLGWPFAARIAVTLVGFAVVGSATLAVGGAARGVPDGQRFASLLRGTTNGWADLLSTAPPVDAVPQLVAVPFATAWFASMIGSELAYRSHIAAAPLVGPFAAMALMFLFGSDDRSIALRVGVGFFLVALALVGLRSRRRSVQVVSLGEHSSARILRARSLLGVGGLLGAASILAFAFAPHVPYAEARERFDLRELQDPPLDPRDAPSPLSDLKGSLDDSSVAFRAFGSTVRRWRIAVLDDYDGRVWSVSGEFQKVDTTLPEDDRLRDRTRVDQRIEVVSLRSFWVPSPGHPTAIDPSCSGEIEGSEQFGFRFEPSDRTAVLATGLNTGLTYCVEAATEVNLEDVEGLADRSDLQSVRPPPDAGVFSAIARAIVDEAESDVTQARALQEYFLAQTTNDDALPGHSVGHLDRFLRQEPLLGLSEQYAAAYAVLARSIGLPARVVVGYQVDSAEPDGPVEVLASDLTAWAEVRFEDVGWATVDVTPTRQGDPSLEIEEQTGTAGGGGAAPPPPADPPETTTPPEPEPEAEDDEEQEDDDEAFTSRSIPFVAKIVGVVVGIPVVLGAVIASVILLLKGRRSKRRRNASPPGAIVGAWKELVDQTIESGKSIRDTRSIRTTASDLTENAGFGEPEVATLADLVERASFHEDPPSGDHAVNAWNQVDEFLVQMRSEASRATRIRTRLNPSRVLNG